MITAPIITPEVGATARSIAPAIIRIKIAIVTDRSLNRSKRNPTQTLPKITAAPAIDAILTASAELIPRSVIIGIRCAIHPVATNPMSEKITPILQNSALVQMSLEEAPASITLEPLYSFFSFTPRTTAGNAIAKTAIPSPRYAPRHPKLAIKVCTKLGTRAAPTPIEAITMPKARPRFSLNQPATTFE
ncbi:hypothetical protein D3C87_1518450 [compost metagenome]